MNAIEKLREMKLDKKYKRSFDTKTKRFSYSNKAMKTNNVECPDCGARAFDRRAVSMTRCNVCGWKEE